MAQNLDPIKGLAIVDRRDERIGTQRLVDPQPSTAKDLLVHRMRRYQVNNPFANPQAGGLTLANNATASATATAVFNDLNTGTYVSRQGAEFYLRYGTQMGVMGAVLADPAATVAPFSRTNGAVGIHYFKTASPEVELVCGSSGASTARLRVLVDDGTGFKYVDPIGAVPQNPGKTYLNILFTDPTPRERTFAIEHILDVTFEGVRVLPNYTVSPAERARPAIVVTGDSTVECTVGDTGSFTRAAVWQTCVRDMTGLDVRGLGAGGTGFVTPSSSLPYSHDARIQQVIDATYASAGVWVCSTNDGARTRSEMRTAVFKIIDAVRASRGAQFPMVFLGMYGGGRPDNSGHLNVETWVMEAVNERIALGDKYLAAKPHLTSSSPIHISLTTGGDASHNTVTGYKLIGRRIASDLLDAFGEMGV